MPPRSLPLALALLLLPARGASPQAKAPTIGARVVTVVSADTGAPVPAAAVTVAGRALRTDGSGRVVLAGSERGAVEVAAQGYLLRQSELRGQNDRLTLWPIGGAYSAEYVHALLYTPAHLTREAAPAGGDATLARIVARRVSVVPSASLRADPLAMRAHRQAVAAVNEATEGRVVFSVDGAGAGDMRIRTRLDPAASADALAYRDVHRGVVVGGEVVFASPAAARDPRYLAHELGHALGLQHSTVPTDMMYFACGDQSPYAFTPNERLTIRLLLQRPPGNRYPDDDRAAVLPSGTATSLRSAR